MTGSGDRTVYLLVVATCFARPAAADVVNVFAAKDNTLYESPTGSLSNGAGDAIFAGRNRQFQDSLRRALRAFDLAGAVPAGSTIVSATLRSYCIQSVSGDQPTTLHRTQQAWGESTSSADGIGGGGLGAFAMPGDANLAASLHPGRSLGQCRRRLRRGSQRYDAGRGRRRDLPVIEFANRPGRATLAR